MLLYYITDRTPLGPTEPERRSALLRKISEAAHAGVDFIQLREKDLPSGEQQKIAHEAAALVRELSRGRTRLLINSRSDIALAAGAAGVHLRSHDVSADTIQAIWRRAHAAQPPLIAISCHTDTEVRTVAGKADFAVFSPVFQDKNPTPVLNGLRRLAAACAFRIPVLALGGVTLENAARCRDAGAAGVAGIRLFQEGDLTHTVAELRASLQTK